MNAKIVKQRISRANKRMQLQNMQRQALGGWDANYHLVSDFTNADRSNKWDELKETACAVLTVGLIIVAVMVFVGAIA